MVVTIKHVGVSIRSVWVQSVLTISVASSAAFARIFKGLRLIKRYSSPPGVILTFGVNGVVVTLVSGTPTILDCSICQSPLHITQTVRIHKSERVVDGVGVTVPALRLWRLSTFEQWINTREPPLGRRIVPVDRVIEPCLIVPFLLGELLPYV